MKPVFGTPGMTSGFLLRILQCLFATASIATMASSSGFASATSFWHHEPGVLLEAASLFLRDRAMGLQVLWSFGLACLDVHALRVKKDLHSQVLLSLVVIGDWLTAILALAAASSSAGVMVLIVKDLDTCKLDHKLSCDLFQISIGLAFFAWFLLVITSHTVLWLLASLS